MQKLNKNNYYLVRNIYVIDSNVGMGEFGSCLPGHGECYRSVI